MIKSRYLFMLSIALHALLYFPLAVAGETLKGPSLYLYVGEKGDIYTFRAERAWLGGMGVVSRSPVTSKEVAELIKLGMKINLVKEPGVAVDRRVQKKSPAPELLELPVNYSLVQYGGATYGGFYIKDTGGNGKGTHWFNTTLQSQSGSNFFSHLAIGLVADADQLVARYPPAMAPQGVANGIIVGNVTLNQGGCGSPPSSSPPFNMQVESFWNGGNKLYDETCYPQELVDGNKYLIDLHANRGGYVTYIIYEGIYPVAGWISPTVSTINDRPAGKSGALSGNGFITTLITDPTSGSYALFEFEETYNGWF